MWDLSQSLALALAYFLFHLPPPILSSTIPNNLDAKKVVGLKDLLKLKGVSLKGKNAELIARLQIYSGMPKAVTRKCSKVKSDPKKPLSIPALVYTNVHQGDL